MSEFPAINQVARVLGLRRKHVRKDIGQLPGTLVHETNAECNSAAGERPELTNDILRERLDSVLSIFKGEESELIPILQRVQAEFSCLRDEAMLAIAQFTGVPESRVYSVATFYEQFHFAPVGKKHVMACRGASCYVRGAPQILNALEKQLGIKVGETTKDLEYSLGTIGCTGTCALSPCIMINDKVESGMTPQKVAKLFKKGART